MARKLFHFNGGIYPPQHKRESTSSPIALAPFPSQLIIPLRQQTGDPLTAVINPGERVLKGQLIGRGADHHSAAIHAPTSGIIIAIEPRTVPHPSGLPDPCIVLEADGEDCWIDRRPLDYQSLDKGFLCRYLREAGLVDLAGEAFSDNIGQIKTLVINAAQSEPYITSDEMLMRERADEVVLGAAIIQWILDPAETLIGIEEDKPEAIAAMQAAVKKNGLAMAIVAVPALFPICEPRLLIRVLTGIEVPASKALSEWNMECVNVATAYAVHRAVNHGEPVISRIVTIAGNVNRPRNYEALIGTPINDLLTAAGEKRGSSTWIMGGPMRGFALHSPHVPVTRATNCVIAASPANFPPPQPEMPCIRCTACASACPVDLQPQELFKFSKAKNLAKAKEYNLFDCIECGCCSYVCPSNIPLVPYFRFAKSEVLGRDQEKRTADHARNRYEFHKFRLEREKAEKAERLAARRAAEKAAAIAETVTTANTPSTQTSDEKRAAIAAAIARAKAKKAGIVPKNTNNLTPEQRAEIAQIDARRDINGKAVEDK